MCTSYIVRINVRLRVSREDRTLCVEDLALFEVDLQKPWNLSVHETLLQILTLPILMGSATDHGEGKDVYG